MKINQNPWQTRFKILLQTWLANAFHIICVIMKIMQHCEIMHQIQMFKQSHQVDLLWLKNCHLTVNQMVLCIWQSWYVWLFNCVENNSLPVWLCYRVKWMWPYLLCLWMKLQSSDSIQLFKWNLMRSTFSGTNCDAVKGGSIF